MSSSANGESAKRQKRSLDIETCEELLETFEALQACEANIENLKKRKARYEEKVRDIPWSRAELYEYIELYDRDHPTEWKKERCTHRESACDNGDECWYLEEHDSPPGKMRYLYVRRGDQYTICDGCFENDIYDEYIDPKE